MEELFNKQMRCLYCKNILKGRSDKKYCNTACKNTYNNPINREREQIFKNDDKQMHLNHKVLRLFYEDSQCESYIKTKPLFQLGFDPSFYTGTLRRSSTGEIFYLVYDYAFVYDKELGIKIFHHEGGFHTI